MYRSFFARVRHLMNYTGMRPPAWHEDRRPNALADALLQFHRECGLALASTNSSAKPTQPSEWDGPLDEERIWLLENMATAAAEHDTDPTVRMWARLMLKVLGGLRDSLDFNERLAIARRLLDAHARRVERPLPMAAATVLSELHGILDNTPLIALPPLSEPVRDAAPAPMKVWGGVRRLHPRKVSPPPSESSAPSCNLGLDSP